MIHDGKGPFPDNKSEVNKCRAHLLTTNSRGKDEILYGSHPENLERDFLRIM